MSGTWGSCPGRTILIHGPEPVLVDLYLHEGSIEAREQAANIDEAIDFLEIVWSLGWRAVDVTLLREGFGVASFQGTIEGAIEMLRGQVFPDEAAMLR